MKNGSKSSPVLTIAEVAKYLRLSKPKVLRLAEEGEIPGRQVEGEWRFLRAAIDEWLGKSDRTQRLLKQAGDWADDESVPELLRFMYKDRANHAHGTKP